MSPRRPARSPAPADPRARRAAGRTLRRGRGAVGALVMGAVLALGLGLAACGEPVPARAELIDALQRSGVPNGEARCAATAILGELDHDQVAAIVERGASGLPTDDPDRTDDANDRVRAALLACRDAAVTSTAPTTTATTEAPSPEPGAATSSTSTRPTGSTAAP